MREDHEGGTRVGLCAKTAAFSNLSPRKVQIEEDELSFRAPERTLDEIENFN